MRDPARGAHWPQFMTSPAPESIDIAAARCDACERSSIGDSARMRREM
jgi:hypothetical protein